MTNATVFWSYAREDDLHDGGRIVALADAVRAEYSLTTSEPLDLFVDRDGIAWGDAWRERIDTAIAGTTFFVPVLTPTYFTRPECRRELFEFVGQARRLGLEELLLPVLYVSVPQLLDVTAPDDELMQLVKSYQWEDLTDLRLFDSHSSSYRTAVNRLVTSIARRVVEVTTVAPTIGDDVLDLDDDDEPGLLERMAELEKAIPQASETLDRLNTVTDRITELTNQTAAEMVRADAQHKGFAARLAIAERFAAMLREPATVISTLGAEYARELAAMNPGMLTLIEQASIATGAEAEQAREFLGIISGLDASSRGHADALLELLPSFKEVGKMSRSMRPPLVQMETGLRSFVDGREIINGWVRRVDGLDEDPGA